MRDEVSRICVECVERVSPIHRNGQAPLDTNQTSVHGIACVPPELFGGESLSVALGPACLSRIVRRVRFPDASALGDREKVSCHGTNSSLGK